jgi:hypothetical protein
VNGKQEAAFLDGKNCPLAILVSDKQLRHAEAPGGRRVPTGCHHVGFVLNGWRAELAITDHVSPKVFSPNWLGA